MDENENKTKNIHNSTASAYKMMTSPLPCPQQTHVSNIVQHLPIHIMKIVIVTCISIPQAHTTASLGTHVDFEVETSTMYMFITWSISNTNLHRNFAVKHTIHNTNEVKNNPVNLTKRISSPNPHTCIFTKFFQQVCCISMVHSPESTQIMNN